MARAPHLLRAFCVAVLLALAPGAVARAFADTLPACDDCSSDAVPLGFSINFFGQTYDSVYVNNNGNLTFGAPLATFTPFGLVGTSAIIIAPFFADVDTRGGGTVSYSVCGSTASPAFCVIWDHVGYFSSHGDKTDTFGVEIDAVNTAGDFDIRFEYAAMGWETGDASGGMTGLGGSSAHVGFSNGTTDVNASFELPGSGDPGTLIDGGSHALVSHALHGTRPGTYRFEVRSGKVQEADLSLSMIVTPDNVGIGGDLTYTFRVDNLGPAAATNVFVADALPLPLTFKSSSGCVAADSGMGPDVVTCAIGDLAPGQSGTASFVATRTQDGDILNAASLTADQPDPQEDNNDAIVTTGTVPPCFGDVLLLSRPKSVTYHPTATRTARARLLLAVINHSSSAIDVRDVQARGDAPFIIRSICPTPGRCAKSAIPKTVKAGKRKYFFVNTARAAGTGVATATSPYFVVSFVCGGATTPK